MFVKRLRVAGFKSFADPIALEFEPGINVIVGPNGSGKSNIADAMAWVLGAQAPSSLRSGSMEDVIFAGSTSRPRLGMAEVELTLDNSSGVLPLDLSEVTISRFADRAGVSEYRINGAACRLIDIAELLSDTGIGRSLHTVVGQGQLDAVLHAKAEERRLLIEEAAQVGKYRRRKDRALRKLERVDGNLTRLGDMVSELTRGLRPLKRQANAAVMYSELTTEHRELKQRMTATEVRRLASEDAESDPEEETRRVQLLSDELSSTRARLEHAGAERESLAVASERAQQVAHGLARVTDRLGGLRRLAHERAAVIAARLAAETEEGYRERIRLLESERARWKVEAARLATDAESIRGRAQEARRRASDAGERAHEAEGRLAAARTKETEAAQALVRAEGAEAAGRATIGALEARVDAVVERRQVAETELAAQVRAVAQAESEVRALEQELDRAAESAAEAETEMDAARTRVAEIKERLGITHAERAAVQARLETLEEVRGLFADQPQLVERIAPLIDGARRAAQAAAATEEDVRRTLADGAAVVETCWAKVAREDEELRRLDALMSGAVDRLSGTRRKSEAHEVERAALDEELARVKEALAAAEQAATEERATLPAHRAVADEAASVRADAEEALGELRRQVDRDGRAAAEAEIEARGAEERALAAQLRFEEAEGGIADAQAALAGLEDVRARLRSARARAEQIGMSAATVAERAAGWASEAQFRADRTRDEAHAADRHLASLHDRERVLEQRLEEVSRRRNEAEIRRAETRARRDAVGERAMDEWGLGIDDLLALEPFDVEGEDAAAARIEELDRQMRRMGAVNPRAAEEYAELAERETFLQSQIEDLKTSRRDLLKIVREVDETVEQVFGAAYEQVAREFEIVFDRLFPGGEGRLGLTDPDDLLSSGIEVEARPAGKNVKKMSLLSGGERSLVALAFLFAIFRARPSPFYLLDEVEAALDDINLQRFLGLVGELEQNAQILIVTHQKRTMEAADVLYGVSMGKDGVSNIVAKRMEEVTL
ncbi:MAG: chromosome segregation SMC family protein [Actinomycetota bacterium]